MPENKLKAELSDTGNGPCLEITLPDGTFIWVTDIDGCGFPTKSSWSVGHYQEDGDFITNLAHHHEK